MTTNRETARDALATLLSTNLTGVGNPAQAVYNHRPSDFDSQSPVVIVTSAGSNRLESTYSTEWDNRFYLAVEVWVLYADPASSWTEANAEDRLDLIDTKIAETLKANYSHPSGAWDRISYAQRSQVFEVNLGGDPWLRETNLLLVEKDDAN